MPAEGASVTVGASGAERSETLARSAIAPTKVAVASRLNVKILMSVLTV
jgi:hypothetical protein